MYNIGDLIVFNDLSLNTKYTGIIIDTVNDKHWWGGGYYVFDWEYPQNFQGTKDNKASFEQLRDWINDKEAEVFTVVK